MTMQTGTMQHLAPSGIAYTRIRNWPSYETEAWMRSHLDALCLGPYSVAVIAVGSSVRNVAASADLDLIVIHDEMLPPYEWPDDVDVRLYPRGEVEGMLAAGHELLGWAVNYGLLLGQKHGFWTELVKRWVGRVPLPSADAAEERARKAFQTERELRLAGDWDAAEEQRLWAFTHQARALLIRAGTYPASRPELPGQLRGIGENAVADTLEGLIAARFFRGIGAVPSL